MWGILPFFKFPFKKRHWLLLEWPGDWGALSSLRPNLLKQALPVKCWHVTWRDVWRRRRVTGISDKSRNHVTACAVWPPTTADCHQGCEFRRKLVKVFCFSELCLNICKASNFWDSFILKSIALHCTEPTSFNAMMVIKVENIAMMMMVMMMVRRRMLVRGGVVISDKPTLTPSPPTPPLPPPTSAST